MILTSKIHIMRLQITSTICYTVSLVTLAGVTFASTAAHPTPAIQPTPTSTPEGVVAPVVRSVSSTQNGGIPPEVLVDTPNISWGEPTAALVPYTWDLNVENPNPQSIIVRVRLNFVSADGVTLHEDWVAAQLKSGQRTRLTQNGNIANSVIDLVIEAQAHPEAWWGDEPYAIRTLFAYATNLRTLDVFVVLESWLGRPITATGTVDLYVLEIDRLRAELEGGAMRRGIRQLYARRFIVGHEHFAPRQIGFLATEYTPPAVTLGPINFSVFDEQPRGHEGLVRLVFRTASGAELTKEDRVYF